MFGACSGTDKRADEWERSTLVRTLAGWFQRASSTMKGLPIAIAAATCAEIQVLTNVGDGCEATTETHERVPQQLIARSAQGSCYVSAQNIHALGCSLRHRSIWKASGAHLVPVIDPHVDRGKVDARRRVVGAEVLAGLLRPCSPVLRLRIDGHR